MPAKTITLEARTISYRYRGGQAVFENLNFSMQSGESVALLGPSGCGKSTFAQILAGYIQPDEGQILIDGKSLPPQGFCPVQLIYQHPEKALNPRWKLRRSLTEASNPSPDFLDKMGINAAWLDRFPRELSGGELQRFCIARALAPQTRFVVADEISTMLDVITQAQVWEFVLNQVKQRNLGLLTVTHSLELAKKVSSRIVLFEELLG